MICPTRPKPATITRLSGLSTRSNSRGSGFAKRGSITFEFSDISSGLTIIEMVTTITSISASDGSITRWVTASENSTKPNSPACGSANAMPRALSPEWRVTRASVYSSRNFTTIKPVTNSATRPGCSINRPRLAAMPTDMKNKPSSRPLNGPMWASSS